MPSAHVRTATFFLPDARFDAKGMNFDFEIRALEGDAVIKFVRVVKLRIEKGGSRQE